MLLATRFPCAARPVNKLSSKWFEKFNFTFFVDSSRDSMEGIMAEHHQQYMRPNPLRLFPEGSDMDPASAAAAAAAMLTEKARNALGLPPSPFWTGGAQQAPSTAAQRPRNPLETAFQPFVSPSAAAVAMSQLYSRNGAAPGAMIPPPHFWSQFYGLNHQLGLLSGLAAGNFTPVGPESTGSAGSPPSPSSVSPAGSFQSHQRYSPYSIPAGKSQLRTPSPRVAPPSPK